MRVFLCVPVFHSDFRNRGCFEIDSHVSKILFPRRLEYFRFHHCSPVPPRVRLGGRTRSLSFAVLPSGKLIIGPIKRKTIILGYSSNGYEPFRFCCSCEFSNSRNRGPRSTYLFRLWAGPWAPWETWPSSCVLSFSYSPLWVCNCLERTITVSTGTSRVSEFVLHLLCSIYIVSLSRT